MENGSGMGSSITVINSEYWEASHNGLMAHNDIEKCTNFAKLSL